MTNPTKEREVADAVKWGIISTADINRKVIPGAHASPKVDLVGVASRDRQRAEEYAKEWDIPRAYGSYEELLADPDVDAVYVATPHAQHHLVVSAALRAGKPVLVEKAVTCTAAAAHDLAAIARAEGVFLMEAMWTRFLPTVVALREAVTSGAIGDLRTVHADFGFPLDPPDPSHRLLDPAQGGGALLDLGVYPVSFAQMLLGTPTTVATTGLLGPTGVDVEAALLLGWPSGAQALLSCSLVTTTFREAHLAGTGGRIVVEESFHNPPRFTVHRDGTDPEVVELPPTGKGYVHQLAHVQECLAAGLTESPVMPLDDTTAVMDVLEDALVSLGAFHADEGFGAGVPA
jgi:predicted dehydrogenase